MNRTTPIADHQSFFAAPARLFDLLNLWQARIDERRQMMHLDERLLKDAGMSRAEMSREARKPFWRA